MPEATDHDSVAGHMLGMQVKSLAPLSLVVESEKSPSSA